MDSTKPKIVSEKSTTVASNLKLSTKFIYKSCREKFTLFRKCGGPAGQRRFDDDILKTCRSTALILRTHCEVPGTASENLELQPWPNKSRIYIFMTGIGVGIDYFKAACVRLGSIPAIPPLLRRGVCSPSSIGRKPCFIHTEMHFAAAFTIQH
jgi:hypothetical protein